MTVEGKSRLLRKLERLSVTIPQRITDELEAGAANMHSLAVRRVQANSGNGVTYVRGGVTHTASAPGEYPNSDTGALVNSMGWRATSALSTEFYAGIEYAKWLEFGTTNMAPRPFMRPTFIYWRKRISERVASAIKITIKEAKNGR